MTNRKTTRMHSIFRPAEVAAKRASKSRPSAGFSLIELLVTISIALLMAAIGLPALFNFVNRGKIEGTARQFVTTMQLAKIESIKMGFPAVIRIDPVNNRLQAYLNIEDPGGTQWDFDPDNAKPYQTTDYMIREIGLPFGVSLKGPGGSGERVDGLTPDPSGGDGLMIFQPNGSVRDVGAYRIGDERGNFLEARVEPLGTARIELQKWDADLSIWAAAGEEGKPWEWY